ncbi:MAG TPA: DUF5683 domain-containing protein [Candidatus Marinimicrobia bacterium]|mgnify:FL=1|nr:DUF5683 domain-containing protein [Candidatus Neomarinimicrobiota bacterium]HRS51271.1 DUF5683 domain-containing protein [Candidatus Neomarinimicrobiota bacterium]HRU91491.1 DUF5683 domain-containing protein [Candidatus Neomarinimicrobiota bacterium]
MDLKRIFLVVGLLIILQSNLQSASPADTLLKISPKGAFIRSAIIPGWGQVYNKKPVKGVLLLSAEGYFLYNFFYYNRIHGYVKTTKETLGVETWVGLTEEEKKAQVLNVTGYELTLNSWRPREKRNKYGWWSLGTYLFGLLDAVVDAHLINFPKGEIELSGTETGLNFSMRVDL